MREKAAYLSGSLGPQQRYRRPRTSNWLRPLALRPAPLARTAKLAGGVAGDGIAPHARLAHVHALAEVLRVVDRVVLRDALPLFGRVVRFLRAGRKAAGQQETVN